MCRGGLGPQRCYHQRPRLHLGKGRERTARRRWLPKPQAGTRLLTNFTLELRTLLTRAVCTQPSPVSFGEASGAERVFASVKCGRLDPSGHFPFIVCLPRNALAQLLLRCSHRRRVRAVVSSATRPPSDRIFQSCVYLGRSQRRQIGFYFCRCSLSSRVYSVVCSRISHAVKGRTWQRFQQFAITEGLFQFTSRGVVMHVLTHAAHRPPDFVAFQLPEFGPCADQMFVVEVACGSR